MLIRISTDEISTFLKCLRIGYRFNISKNFSNIENSPQYKILLSDKIFTNIILENEITKLYLDDGMKKINSSRKFHKKNLFVYEISRE